MSVTPTLEITQFDVAHTGPETPAGRFLRRFWTPVARLDDLEPGTAKPLRIMNELFTCYRGESGEPHLVGFYCAHRSTQMSTGFIEGDEIRCFYHGWKYNGLGQCIEQPAEADGFAAKVSIEGYPVQTYLGLVYAYLGPGEPPRVPALQRTRPSGPHREPFVRAASPTTGTDSRTRATRYTSTSPTATAVIMRPA